MTDNLVSNEGETDIVKSLILMYQATHDIPKNRKKKTRQSKEES